MATSIDAWISVLVKRGVSVVKPRTVVSCMWSDTFACLLFQCGFGEEAVQSVVISSNEKFVDPCHIVPLSAPVSICDQFKCHLVCFHLREAERQETPSRNAFTVLMSSAHERSLPPHVESSSGQLRADHRLRNDLLDELKSMNIPGWTRDSVSTTGERCIRSLAAALWYIDANHSQFKDRNIKIPSCFEKFQGYDDFIAKKKKKPRLSADGLKIHVDALSDLLSQPWFSRPTFRSLKEPTEGLVDAFQRYREYLRKHASIVSSAHHSQVVGIQNDKTSLSTLSPSNEIPAIYSSLIEVLENKPLYDPIFVQDFAPTDRFERRRWLHDLVVPFDAMLYTYAHGNSFGSLNFIWRVEPEIDQNRNSQTLMKLSSNLPVFYSRDVRRTFVQTYNHLCGTPKSVLRNIFATITGDLSSAASSAEQAVNERVAKALVHLDDPNIMLDLRRNNGRVKNSSFDPFWDELHVYLDEITPAVDERRHSTILHMPIAVSVRHLRDIISDRLTQKFPTEEKEIPSIEWIRYQFWPRNSYSSSALRYTGRFAVKFGIQCRQMRKSHPDAHYVNALLQYVKGFVLKFKNFCQYISADDKAIIPVGEPDLPISTGVRGHNRSLVPAHGSRLEALDHDFHIHGIVPSVSLFVSIPDDVHGSFYSGKVFVTCKDKVTQPSSAMRHVTELMSIVTTYFSTDGFSSPIVVLVTDGGPDHRLTFASVKISLLAFFLGLNLDMLVAVRTCPYQSWTNLVERVMSTLNLALQNVSLARKKMSDEAETTIKGKNTLTDVRAVVERSEVFKQELRDSMSQPMVLLAKQFTAMQLKGEPLLSGIAASDQEIQAMFERVHLIDPNLIADNVTKDVLEASQPLQTFLKNHSHSSHYTFQLKKCTSEACVLCSEHKIRLPCDIFSSLTWLPLPLLDFSKDHYLPFESVYGKEVSEKDRPSLKGTWEDEEAVAADASNKDLFNAAKVRDIIVCQECYKPRCIYAKGKLSWTERVATRKVKESHLFTCGCALFPESSNYHGTIVVRQKLSCSTPMEAQYYSAKLVYFPPVCYYCGCPEETLCDSDEIAKLKEEYAVVRPICFLCLSSGKKVHTSHPSNMAKRKKV